MTSPIDLVIGLGNPGERYAATRHNAGLRFVEQAAQRAGAVLRREPKFEGRLAVADVESKPVRLFAPATFMNLSGRPVAKVVKYYRIPIEQVLVVHDELDLPPGTVRLKRGGGHGGHNGLRDIFLHLGSQEFLRLRIGIGHPGSADDVVDYVLQQPSASDAKLIEGSIEAALTELPRIVSGDIERAMHVLHTG